MLNNDLVEYLNKYFVNPNDISAANLDAHFLTKFGVNAKQGTVHHKLFLFDYDQQTVKWTYPLSHLCRGIIVRWDVFCREWFIVSWGFNKFFNLLEPSCPITKAEYAQNPQGYRLLSKEDGTLIQLYKYEEEWRVSTRGAITTERYNDQPYTFESLFWDTVQQDVGLDKRHFCCNLDVAPSTYMFELCTPYNRIVSRYPTPRIYLIGQRELTYGRLLTHGEVDTTARKLGCRRPDFAFCNEFPTFDSLIEFAEKDALTTEPDEPEYKEGFVLYDDSKPIGKIKNKPYLLLHSIMGGHDSMFTIKNIVRCYFGGTLDDIYSALPEVLQKGADTLKQGFADLVAQLVAAVAEVNKQHCCSDYSEPKEEQKHYAQVVMKVVPELVGEYGRTATGYFFQQKKDIVKGVLGNFSSYVQENCEKQMDYWKAVVKI